MSGWTRDQQAVAWASKMTGVAPATLGLGPCRNPGSPFSIALAPGGGVGHHEDMRGSEHGVVFAPLPLLEPKTTHRCGGCEGGAPCSSCGGNIPKSSPAYQALSFGMAISKAISDPMWRAVAVGQTLRDAPARDDAPEWHALDAMVGRGLTPSNFSPIELQGSAAIAAGILSPEITPPDFICRDLWWGPPPLALSTCCPTFNYPSILTVLAPTKVRTTVPQLGLPPTEEIDAAYIQVHFEGDVSFQGPPPCDCSCCEFRQDIMLSTLFLECADARFKHYNPNPTDGEEDCVWWFCIIAPR